MAYQSDLEMQPYGEQHPLPYPAFLARVDTTRGQLSDLTSSVDRLAALHQRALSSASPDAVQREIDGVVASAQSTNRAIRQAIQTLKDDAENSTGVDFRQKRAQVETLKRSFQTLVQRFLDEENAYQAGKREAVARQYRVVNPYASEEEVRGVVEGGGDVFQSALRDGRSGQAVSALGAVRARQTEIQQIEQSIAELTRLFQELETLVLMDEPKTQRIQDQTKQADMDIIKATEEVQVAQRSAIRRRKMKWICLGICVAIVIVVAVIILIWLKVTGRI